MRLRFLPVLAAAALLGACGKDPVAPRCEATKVTIPTVVGDTVTLPSGVVYVVGEEGEGEVAQAGSRVTVHYEGYLTDGTLFDSSVLRGQPITFSLAQVIPGFAQGITGMKEGGKRQITIPPALAYGAQGAPPCIPPDATLIFDVTLIEVL